MSGALSEHFVPMQAQRGDHQMSKALRIVFFIVGMAGVSTSIFVMHRSWDDLNRLERGHKDKDTLHVEYCPNLNVYAASGNRFNDMLHNFHYHAYEFHEGNETVTLFETKMLNILDRVGVRFLSWGLVRLHSMEISINFVDAVSTADAAVRTWSDTSRQWTLVATGSPASTEHCTRPELFQVVRYLIRVVSRHGFLAIEPRRDFFHAPRGIFIEDDGLPSTEAMYAPEVWSFLALHLFTSFLVCMFAMSVIDGSITQAYREFVEDVVPTDTPSDSSIMYSAGPIFIADHIDSGIMRDAPVADALYGAVRILIAITLPMLPFFPMLVFAPTRLIASVFASVLELYLLISTVYGVVYTLNMPWRSRRIFAWTFYGVYTPLSALAIFGTVNWIIWLLVFVSYDPMNVGAILVVVASTVAYGIAVAKLIVRILNATELPPWVRTLDKGITRQELAQYVLRFSVVVIMLACIVFSGWVITSPADQRTPEQTSTLIMAGIVPLGQYIASLQMRRTVDRQMPVSESDLNGIN